MQEQLSQINQIIAEIKDFQADTKDKLETFKSKYIGKKGEVASLFEQMKNIAAEQRKAFGIELNRLKEVAQDKFKELSETVEAKTQVSSSKPNDLTLPPVPYALGSIHPLVQTRARIVEIFERIGFTQSEATEIEDDYHNFTALNFPPNHPAREMQDTFFIEKNQTSDMLLRTHTSSVQIRLMQQQKPPIRSLMIGRVYRNEAISARAHCLFHQVEGLYVDENVGFADLKQTLYHFAKELFGKDIKVRYRPSYFPFTEPSAEIDITCLICKGKGCNVCKYSGWVEIAGSGMVHPNVLENCGIDSEKYTGFAFGMGIERITMLKYQIKDLRLFTENDVRFLRQF
ncbi:MAG: phenylalanine--tRNA ligase subunit alpha [Cytophagales bacterium]|nr:MAG: phenylalanine--tRNA ligase subunit alpha [Cytophagales bacterium]